MAALRCFRNIKVIQLESLVVDFRVIGDGPMRLNWKEWREEDWEEETWTWLDPEEQEYEEEGFWEEPCGFRDLEEAITPGAVTNLNTNLKRCASPDYTTEQIVDIRLMSNAQSERFRVVLSDGEHLQQAVLAPHLYDQVNNTVVRGSIVFLLDYKIAAVQNRSIVIVLDMHVVKRDANIVGNPIHFPSG